MLNVSSFHHMVDCGFNCNFSPEKNLLNSVLQKSKVSVKKKQTIVFDDNNYN